MGGIEGEGRVGGSRHGRRDVAGRREGHGSAGGGEGVGSRRTIWGLVVARRVCGAGGGVWAGDGTGGGDEVGGLAGGSSIKKARKNKRRTSSESCGGRSLLIPRWRVDCARAWRRVMRVGPMLGGMEMGCMFSSLRMAGEWG